MAIGSAGGGSAPLSAVADDVTVTGKEPRSSSTMPSPSATAATASLLPSLPGASTDGAAPVPILGEGTFLSGKKERTWSEPGPSSPLAAIASLESLPSSSSPTTPRGRSDRDPRGTETAIASGGEHASPPENISTSSTPEATADSRAPASRAPPPAKLLKQFTGFRGLFDWQAGVRRFALFIYGLRPIAGCVFSMCVFI